MDTILWSLDLRTSWVLAAVRDAVRRLRRNVWMSLAILASVLIGLCLNASLIRAWSGLLWAPLGPRHPEELLNVFVTSGRTRRGLSQNEFDLLRSSPAIDGAVAYFPITCTAVGDSAGSIVRGQLVSPEFFTVVGAKFKYGSVNNFQAQPAYGPVVISSSLLRRLFGSTLPVLGRTVSINRVPHVIVGVMDGSYRGLKRGETDDLWLPLGSASILGIPSDGAGYPVSDWLSVTVRSRQGGALSNGGMASVLLGRFQNGSQRGSVTNVLLAPTDALSPTLRRSATALFATSTVVFCVAIANICILLISSGVGRRLEMGTRYALGASSRQLGAIVAIEHGVLLGSAALVGVFLIRFGLDLFGKLITVGPAVAMMNHARASLLEDVEIVASLCVATAVISTLISRTANRFTVEQLRTGRVVTAVKGFGRHLMTSALVVQVAGAFVLSLYALSLDSDGTTSDS